MKKIMNIVAVLIAAVLLSGAADNFSRVARIFGRDIFLTDLNPTDDELKMLKQMRRDLDDKTLSDVRDRKLASLIWDPIMDEFLKTHDVKPTEAEMDDFTRVMANLPLPKPEADRQLLDDSRMTDKMKKEVDREVAESFVKQWKIKKALYEEYGGIVMFQQFNPMEPLGAMRKLLEIHQAKGDFEIYDEELKQRFWKYYLQPTSWKIMKPEDVDYSEPWWMKIPTQGSAIDGPSK
jgi:hypothetical protein